jgi:Flp pilus assembly protein TadB
VARLFGRTGKQPVYQITGARRAVSADVDRRARRYLLSMGVRTVCFLLAVVLHGWLRWLMILAAVLLPYLSVVFANSGRERIESMPVVNRPDDVRAIKGPDP